MPKIVLLKLRTQRKSFKRNENSKQVLQKRTEKSIVSFRFYLLIFASVIRLSALPLQRTETNFYQFFHQFRINNKNNFKQIF